MIPVTKIAHTVVALPDDCFFVGQQVCLVSMKEIHDMSVVSGMLPVIELGELGKVLAINDGGLYRVAFSQGAHIFCSSKMIAPVVN